MKKLLLLLLPAFLLLAGCEKKAEKKEANLAVSTETLIFEFGLDSVDERTQAFKIITDKDTPWVVRDDLGETSPWASVNITSGKGESLIEVEVKKYGGKLDRECEIGVFADNNPKIVKVIQYGSEHDQIEE